MTKNNITYEQPDGWMQKLTSEVDGTTITRHTFTKDRVGINDIPVYIQNENGSYSPKHQWQGLTNDEIVDWFEECFGHDEISETTMWFAKRLLDAVKEKNDIK